LNRRTLTASLGLALTAWPALTQEPPPDPDSQPAEMDAGRDSFDRMTIEVRIGAAGPFDFVVDTGADRSVLAAELAAELGLPEGPPVLVHGITGSQMTPTVQAPPLDLGAVRLPGLDMPVLPRGQLGADGLLGVDALQKRRLVMDFRNRRLEIQPTSRARDPAPSGRETYVSARSRIGRLTLIDAVADGVGVTAFIDSGGGVSIGNPALAAAVRARGGWRSSADEVRMFGVTSESLAGEFRVLDTLRLGDLQFTDVPLVIGDLPVFQMWGMESRPTLLLGIDVLRLFSRVELDYGRRRMLFRSTVEPGSWQA